MRQCEIFSNRYNSYSSPKVTDYWIPSLFSIRFHLSEELQYLLGYNRETVNKGYNFSLMVSLFIFYGTV